MNAELGSMFLLRISSGTRQAASKERIEISAVATDTKREEANSSSKPDRTAGNWPEATSTARCVVTGMLRVSSVKSAANTFDSSTFLVKKPQSDLLMAESEGLRVAINGPSAK